MSLPIVFLDLGGVINDKDQQDAQWQSLVGVYFVKLFGGTQQVWTLAHRVVTDRLLKREHTHALASADFVSFYKSYQHCWVRGLCEQVGRAPPSHEECLALAERAIAWITPHVQAALPSAVEAIHTLHHQGYLLHMASGAHSRELAGYLQGMEVRSYFGRLYGADLINTFKQGPVYYERIFADVGIRPQEALVIDDSLPALTWAAQTGARILLIRSSPLAQTETLPCISSLAELPAFLLQ